MANNFLKLSECQMKRYDICFKKCSAWNSTLCTRLFPFLKNPRYTSTDCPYLLEHLLLWDEYMNKSNSKVLTKSQRKRYKLCARCREERVIIRCSAFSKQYGGLLGLPDNCPYNLEHLMLWSEENE